MEGQRITRSTQREELVKSLEICRRNLDEVETKVGYSLCPSKQDIFELQSQLLNLHLDYSHTHEVLSSAAMSIEEREKIVADHSKFSTKVNTLNQRISSMVAFDDSFFIRETPTITAAPRTLFNSTNPFNTVEPAAELNTRPILQTENLPYSTPVRAPPVIPRRTLPHPPPIPPRPNSTNPFIEIPTHPLYSACSQQPLYPTSSYQFPYMQPQLFPSTDIPSAQQIRSTEQIKLPKINPKSFSGKESEWLEFKEFFRICVGQNQKIDDGVKLIHLKNQLEGEAYKLVAKLPMTAANYQKAWEALEQRYGNTDKIKENLLDQIYGLEKCRSEDIEDVKRLIDEVAIYLGQLQGLDVNVDKEMMLVPIIRDKLPYTWQLEWARRVERYPEDKKVTAFLKFLYQELKIRDLSCRNLSISSPKRGSASALMSNVVEEKKSVEDKKSVVCTYCQGNHFPSDCRNSMSPEERQRLVYEKKCCFKCGMKGHQTRSCNFRKLCDCKSSQPPHVKNLCCPEMRNGHGKVAKGGKQGVLMRSLGLKAFGTTKKNPVVRALLDTGCSYTTVSKSLVNKIKPKRKGSVYLNIETFGGYVRSGLYDVVELTVHGFQNGSMNFQAIVGPENLGGSLEKIPAKCVDEARFFGCVPLADLEMDQSQEIDIMFGEDLYDSIVSGRTIYLDSGIKATPTIFGWMLHGEVYDSPGLVNNLKVIAFRCHTKLTKTLEDFWDTEHLGILPSETTMYPVVEKVRNELTRIDGKYFVTWPWKEGKKEELGSNEEAALSRLRSLLRRQSSEDFHRYNEEIQKLENEGHIERCQSAPDEIVSYLPHRGVLKESRETTKLRIVFDASCKSKGKLSLNQCLESGENIFPSMFDIILRFRMKKVALCGDLAQAFLMMFLQESERDVCRFFWVDEERNAVEFRFRKVFFGCTSSPFLLHVVLQELISTFAEKFKTTVEIIKDNIYVDDEVLSLDDEDGAIKTWKESREIFADGGFNMRKLKSSSSEVLKVLNGEPSSEHDSVLGIGWNAVQDVLIPGMSFCIELLTPTKRGVVSLLGQLYDPLGILSPLIVNLKLLVQDLWSRKVSWDTELEQKDKKNVEKIIKSWNGASNISVPRWIGGTQESKKNLFVFTDASEKSYAAAVYIVVQNGEKIISNLMCSKSRLAPLKGLSIPKLELVAALIGSRLGFTVAESIGLDCSSVYYFTDSRVTLQWINSDYRRWGVFVSNRVKEIQERRGKWFWISGCDNPADIPSRGCGVNGLSYQWFHGPDWLSKVGANEEKFPVLSNWEENQIVVNQFLAVKHVILSYEEDFVNPKRTSQWNRTLRSVVYVLRFVKKIQHKGDVEIWELQMAKNTILRQVQRCLFPSEVHALIEHKPVEKNSKLSTMNPFLDGDGLIRLGGRLQFANITYDEKHPVILSRCIVVDQIVLFYHSQLEHGGIGSVITALRKDGIWILKARKTVGSIIRSCRSCKKFIAAPGAEKTPPFPRTRTTYVRAFSITGVDLGGPLLLKDKTKVWFALFTCMTVRAVHLELVSSLSEKSIDLAFQRFVSRRGTPQIVLSDHGTNFVALSKSLKAKGTDLNWTFVVQRGSWWGGCWERLIGVVKGLLKRTIGNEFFSYEELQTVLINVEKVVNLRPVSYMFESSDRTGLPVPLYPELFLLPAETGVNPELDTVFLNRVEYGKQLMEIWKHEYLFQILGNAGKVWKEDNRPIKEGDVVLIEGDSKNRLNWQIALVTRVFPGPDSRNRVAEVRTSSGQIFKRPIQRLFNLEVSTESKKYCICNGENTGDMIGCDNNDECKYGEWFHFECVNIDVAPEGMWICPFCQDHIQNRP